MSIGSSGRPAFQSLINVPTDPLTQWGSALAQVGGYTYIFGKDSSSSAGEFYGMKVARVPVGLITTPALWQYWNGSTWAAGESDAALVTTTNALTGVVPPAGGTGFMAVSIPGGVYADSTVDVSYACAPQGPWSAAQPVYTVPQIGQYRGEVAYTPTVHPELSNDGSLVVSYNVNNIGDLATFAADDHLYQPRFITLTPG
jgi:hypothetical protein